MPSESYIDSVTTFFEIEMYSKFGALIYNISGDEAEGRQEKIY
ncbi:MAG: hypothetical protein QG646_2210 [Euryarchaeota archaeon]|nr:hypothetical protein [Euryarchaeota archaeon]